MPVIEYSTKIIQSQSNIIYRSLNEKLHDPHTRDRAQKWQPDALAIKAFADSFKLFISDLKKELRSDIKEKREDFKEVRHEPWMQKMRFLFCKKNRAFGKSDSTWKKCNQFWSN